MLVGAGHNARHMASKLAPHVARLDLRHHLVVELGLYRSFGCTPYTSANVVANGAGVVQNTALRVLFSGLAWVAEAVRLL